MRHLNSKAGNGDQAATAVGLTITNRTESSTAESRDVRGWPE